VWDKGYTAMKRMACNKSRWKAANQSKDLRRRRERRRGRKRRRGGGEEEEPGDEGEEWKEE
jgi:hypothetical protein